MTMRLPRPRRRWIAAAVVLVIVVTAFRLLGSASRIDYYRVVDDGTLVVGTVEGPGAWTRVTSITETPSTATIIVSSFLVRSLPGTDVGIQVESVVELRDPIGGRTVVDGSRGEPVQRTRCLPPAYLAPGCT
jgi:hypothetical protein